MISITCTNCRRTLTIDEAFAGGVCRCQHCGTIQTVPGKKAAATSKVYAPPGAGASASPLNELADVVASSGLARSGLTGAPTAQAAPVAGPAAKQRKQVIILIASASGVILLLIVALILVLLMHHPNKTSTTGNGGGPDVISGPSFCGIPIQSGSVIFLLDRGGSIADLFDTLKATCYKSLEQLGPESKFQVILWDNEAGSAEFPAGAMRSATAGAIDDLRHDFQDVVANGTSHLAGPLNEALKRNPQLIVIATAKTDLDEDDSAAVHNAAGKGIRIDAIQIGNGNPIGVLQEVSKTTGGQFTLISGARLREFSQSQ